MTSIETPNVDYARRAFLKRLATSVLVLVAVMAIVDVMLRVIVPASGVIKQTVDIQTPATLYVKLEELRKFQGMKVVVLGDSLVFGRTMRDKGDHDWQKHTLSSQLQNDLAEKYPGRPVLVINLGMNGTLPTDLDYLVRVVLPLKPDLIIFDLTLRSFSRDFDADTQTRTWLRDFNVSANGTYSTTMGWMGVTRWIQDQLVNHWYLYRVRDSFQSVLFDGNPSGFLVRLRNAIDDRFRSQANAGQDDLGDVVLLMRARSRYQNIDLAADNRQRQALDRILRRLTDYNQPTMVFYATENPTVLPQLMDLKKFNDLQGELARIVSGPSNRLFVGPLAIYSPDNFIDHVHLNKEGYQRLSSELIKRVGGLIPKGPN